MKKDLILVGNKIYNDKSKASTIDAFDFVIRVNRMNNLYLTGEKIDGYFLGMYSDFINIYHGGPYKDKIKYIPLIFCSRRIYYKKLTMLNYITQDQYDNIELIDIKDNIKDDMNIEYPTSTIYMLWYLLNSHWCEEYNIYLTGSDIDGREELFRTGDPWKNTRHALTGGLEEIWIKRMMKENRVKVIV